MPVVELTADQVLRRCETSAWTFATTAELEPASEIVGQSRAMRALEFSVTIDADGYNVFVIGPNGTGRMSAILNEVKRAAADKPPAGDWVYLHNFVDARADRAAAAARRRAQAARRARRVDRAGAREAAGRV
jgi:hypothetical protein